MPKLIMLAALSAILFASEPDNKSIEAAVLDTSAKMTQAAQALDADLMFSFMLETNKGSVIQNGIIALTREQALDQVRRGFRGLSKIEYRWKQQHVTVVSPTLAILVGEGESTATTQQGDTFMTPFAQTQVYALKDGRWKVLHAHHSSPARP
jgi:uncharacterized protein (TIGR02246 family)